MPFFRSKSVKRWSPEAAILRGVMISIEEYGGIWKRCIELIIELASDNEEPEDIEKFLTKQHSLVSALILNRKQLEAVRPKELALTNVHIESVALTQCVCGVYNNLFGAMLMDREGQPSEAQILSNRSAEFEPMRDRAAEQLIQSLKMVKKSNPTLHASFLKLTDNPLLV